MSERSREAPPYFLIHLVSREAMTPLVASQVVDHAEIHATTPGATAPVGVAVGLIEPARVALTRALRERAREFARRAPHTRIAVLPFAGRFLGASVAFLAARIARLAGKGRPVVMHCRGEEAVKWASAVAQRLRKAGRRVGIVGDIRGAWPDEFLLARGFDSVDTADASARAAYDEHVRSLRDAFAISGRLLTVSNPLREWLVEHGAPRPRIDVVPCSVPRIAYSEEARTKARTELGIPSETIVLAYVGSVTKYQYVEEGALAFVRHALAHDRNAFLLALTQDRAAFERLAVAAEIPADRYLIKSVSQSAVPYYLCAADAGLLLRAPNAVNAVSMPVKLGEYLSSGLPVIVSRIAGWVDDIIDGAGAGIAVRWFGASEQERASAAANAIDVLRAEGEGFRKHALDLCRRHFLWESHVDAVRRSYLTALGQVRGTPSLGGVVSVVRGAGRSSDPSIGAAPAARSANE